MFLYTILEANDLRYLKQTVNDHIKNGWEPHGTFVFQFYDSSNNIKAVFQAMTKKDTSHR